MIRRGGLILLASGALAIAGLIGSASDSVARSAQDGFTLTTDDLSAQVKKQGAAKAGGAARSGAPKAGGAARSGAPKAGAAARSGAPKAGAAARSGKPKAGAAARSGKPKVGGVAGSKPKVGAAAAGGGFKAIKAGGTGRWSHRGHQYSVWRGHHRHRWGNRWVTFGALSALTVIAIGSASYYPYAYISAPAPVCVGENEDGCQLRWGEVPTLEGPRVFQCVAYCPWQ